MLNEDDVGLANHDEFRTLLGCFATGVTVVTTVDDDDCFVGMTASAVSAVSLEPPLLLVCVNRTARLHAALHRGTGFALSILAERQDALSELFASPLPDPFAGVPCRTTEDGLPLIDGAVAHIVCRSWGAHEAGDHTVFFGEVRGGRVFDRRPLLHYRGAYTTVLPQP